ncbi:MAG: hypothetical protein ACFCVE_11610 [Phycisphaerae bacterium]
MVLKLRVLFVLSAVWAAVGPAAGLAAGLAAGSVQVVLDEPVLSEVRFDPANPPPQMPAMKPDEKGFNWADFHVNVRLRFQIPREFERNGTWTSRLKVTDVTVNASLKDTIYLPHKAPAKLVAHEEGHRRLNLLVWKDAEAAGRAAGRKVINRTFTGTGPTREAARKQASEEASGLVTQTFLETTQGRASKLHEAYDDLTDHGRKPIGEDEAIKRVLDEQKKD